MRVLVSPDSFGDTLTAVEAGAAIAAGWARTAPGDEVTVSPVSDGGPGFVDVLHAALGGQLVAVTVAGPAGDPVPAVLLLTDDVDDAGAGSGGRTAWVEAAQACGLPLRPPGADPETLSTVGVGQLVAAGLEAGARRVVVGLGGSATTDGGAGLLAGLGATAAPAGALTGGPAALAELSALDVGPARDRVAGAQLVVATDVDTPLLGLRGAAAVFGPQKGLAPDRLRPVDEIVAGYAALVEGSAGRGAAGRVGIGSRLTLTPGAGAAGGLGFALLALGARRVEGIGTVADAVGTRAALAGSDLVVTGEGAFDFSSRSGKVVSGVARLAGQAGVPCIVLAGRVEVGSREMRTMGVESGYAMADLVGAAASLERPAESLAALAERVARTWSRR